MFFVFKQKTAFEVRISDWSSDVCSSDLEKLGPDDILSSIREGTEASNIERERRGWDTMKILGWSFKPQYDEQINALEWAILAQMDHGGGQLINYNTRLLGRRGVMEVVRVDDPQTLDGSIASFKELVERESD